MDLELEAFRERARVAVREVVTPHLDAWESSGLDAGIFGDLADRGVLAPGVSRRCGGVGGSLAHSAVLVEEFMRGLAVGPAVSVLVQANSVLPLIERLGTGDMVDRILRPAAAGRLVGCLGATEASGGSDLIGGVRTSAVREGDGWRLSGSKRFITNAPIADFCCLLARTEATRGPFSLTLLLVPLHAEGVSIRTLETVGLRSSSTGEISLRDVWVPLSAVLGAPGRGYVELARVLARERVLIGVGAVALARRCWEKTCEYMQVRVSGGRPLTRHQALRFELAQLAADLCAGEAYAWTLVLRDAAGGLDSSAASLAKFRLCELAQKAIRRCVYFHGAQGWLEGTWMERAARDSEVLSIFAGASEVMRDVVAARILSRGRAKQATGEAAF